MEFKLRILEDGELKISLTLFYILLKNGASLRGPYLYIGGRETNLNHIVNELSRVKDFEIPSINFCPSDEPVRIHNIDEVLGDLCTEIYRYFNDRCSACVIKVYSLISESWLINENDLIRLFEVIASYHLPTQFINGCIVITTCPANYEDANKLLPGTYLQGINLLRCLANDFLRSISR
ncbi:MAG: hypothetical protein QW596_02300 [Sulfolobales archaeon]